MMRYVFAFLLVSVSSLHAQSLRDINFSYLYDPSTEFAFEMKVVRASDWNVFFILQTRDTALRVDTYTIQWELRDDLTVREGQPLAPEINVATSDKNVSSGNFLVSASNNSKILIAKVVNTKSKRAWIFYQFLSPEYPVVTYAKKGDDFLFKPFANISDDISIASDQWTVSYYDDNFPTSSPPFAEAQGRVNRGMRTDSTFTLSGATKINFSKKGLYLLQKDTNATEGLAFRIEDDYPKLSKIQSLAGPMVYVCTQQEYNRLMLSKGDKKTFDRVVLSITADTDRARKFMRNYFRRVELANQYFTSYKEGWKSDRGMIFIVFGLPDEVYKFNDREVWAYRNEDYSVTFNFSKSPSIFDPENYVLIRDKKYQQTWYEVIDLWRNARF